MSLYNWDNKASEVRKVLHELLAVVRETNWSVVLVHHANKQGDTGGTVHWEAAVDYVLSFDKAKNDCRQLVAKWGRWVKAKPERLVFRKVDDRIQLVDARAEASRNHEDQDQGELDKVLNAIPALGIEDQPTTQNTVTVDVIREQTGFGRTKLLALVEKLREGQVIGRNREKVTAPYGYYRYHWA